MVYRALGLMSGASLEGLDIAFVEFHESSGNWNFEVKAVDTFPYTKEWIDLLSGASQLTALDYQLLHSRYGHFIGDIVNRFIDTNHLHHQIQLVASHGHTVFHVPSQKTTSQLGDGAAIAAQTGINTVSDFRAMDVARGGHGAPIVLVGERYLFPGYSLFLHLGAVANISGNNENKHFSFDVCPGNSVLNILASEADAKVRLSDEGTVDEKLLSMLNDLEYYRLPYPKTLSADFGTDVVYTLIKNKKIRSHDALRTYTEHVSMQIENAIQLAGVKGKGSRVLLTGPGAHNHSLVHRISSLLINLEIETVVPDINIVDYKEAIIMALIGILRWREEANTFGSVTGASSDSIGGAVWVA